MGFVFLTEAVIEADCMLHRRFIRLPSAAMVGRIIRCGISSSCQSAVTFETVKQ